MKICIKTFFAAGLGLAMLASCAAQVGQDNRMALPSGPAKIVPSAIIQETYERSDAVKFNFVGRQKSFTQDEIAVIRAVLDKLPDAVLQKVIAGGVTRFLRVEKIPQKQGDLFTSNGHEQAVAVPPGGFIAFADSAFQHDRADIARLVVHQIAHSVAWKEAGGNPLAATGFTGISWAGEKEPFGRKSFNGFVNDYARTNHREDFAESCVYYWFAPEKLRRASPEKFAYMQNRIFEASSPAEVWQDLPTFVFAGPVITSLGDKADEIYSFVSIRGKNFMGPFDGGFNRVRFGGTQALHVPISNETIWSWVPDVSEGDHPITVETQDGKSNAFPFYCTGDPWWKYW